jgi:hypothetical protein
LQARDSILRSPLTYRETGTSPYTVKLRDQLIELYSVLRETVREPMQRQPDTSRKWNIIEAEFNRTRAHVDAVMEGGRGVGHKNKTGLDITYPQLTCVIIPHLKCQVDIARAQWHAYTKSSDRGARRHAEYRDALRRLIVTMVVSDDCMRIANYAHGRVGHNFLLEYDRDRRGKLKAITKLSYMWRGGDTNVEAQTKIRRYGRGAKSQEAIRSVRAASSGLVDYTYLTEYFTMVRVHDLVACGRIPSVEAYDVEKDHWALFVCPKPRHKQSDRVDDWSAHIDTSTLTNYFGQSLHEGMVGALGRNLPAWDSPEITTQYRALFSAHIVRLLFSSYCFGLRGKEYMGLAEKRLMDRRSTIEGHYLAFADHFEEKQKQQGLENPHFFDLLMDQMLYGNASAEQWTAFWRGYHHTLPLTNIHLLTGETPRSSRRRRSPASTNQEAAA